MCYSTAKDLWDNVNQIYSALDNQSRVLELNLKLGDIRQGEYTITQYFHKLTRVWQDLDLFDSYEWESTKDQAHYKKVVEDSCVQKFLTGLNDEFDEVRSRVTSKKPLPFTNEAFSEVHREESPRSVMLGKKSTDLVETSAMMTEATANEASTPPNKPRVWCDHCNKPRHTRETCWRIHVKPANWKNNKLGDKGNNHSAPPIANNVDSNLFN